jgi:hypothetical protein
MGSRSHGGSKTSKEGDPGVQTVNQTRWSLEAVWQA